MSEARDEKWMYYTILTDLREKDPLQEGDVTYPSDFDLVPKDWENFQKSFDKVNALHEIRKHFEVMKDRIYDTVGCVQKLRYYINEYLAKTVSSSDQSKKGSSVFLSIVRLLPTPPPLSLMLS